MHKLTEQARLKSTYPRDLGGNFKIRQICRRGLQTLIFAISFRWIILFRAENFHNRDKN
jgi:hypothetical protein